MFCSLYRKIPIQRFPFIIVRKSFIPKIYIILYSYINYNVLAKVKINLSRTNKIRDNEVLPKCEVVKSMI